MTGPGPHEPNDPLGPSHDANGLRCVELCPICRAADVLRSGGEGEIGGSLRTVQREALLTARAMIDQYIERLDGPGSDQGPRVEDIPIA